MKTKRVTSEETRRKLSKARKKWFANGGVHPMKGKQHSEKTKKKMRLVKLGEKNVRYGTHHTEKIKRKIVLQIK